jgi:hypothetical protein
MLHDICSNKKTEKQEIKNGWIDTWKATIERKS